MIIIVKTIEIHTEPEGKAAISPGINIREEQTMFVASRETTEE